MWKVVNRSQSLGGKTVTWEFANKNEAWAKFFEIGRQGFSTALFQGEDLVDLMHNTSW